MGVTGESVRRLTTDAGHNPSWSPDGTRIVYSTAAIEMQPNIRAKDGDLWIVDTRSGAKRPLIAAGFGGFPAGTDAVQPSWSPSGKRIAYWSVQSGRREISTIEPDARNPKETIVKAVAEAGLHWNPVWSPDGKYLYYGSDRDGTLNFWRVAIDEESGRPESAPEPLSLPGALSGNFSFSHEGAIAFTSVTRSYRLLAVPFDGNGAAESRPLFGGSEAIDSFDLSPDGQSVAFTTGGVQEDLFVAKIDGSRTRQLTNDAARDRGVIWSPDGKTLFFYSNRDGGYHAWSIRADGSNLTRLTDAAMLGRIGRTTAYSPHPSPDGRTVVVDTGSNTTTLIHLERPLASRVERVHDLGPRGFPRWSPDGQRISGATVHGITVYSLRTKSAQVVLPHGWWPQWFPDGKRLLFFEDQRIGVLDLDTRRETSIPWRPLPGVELDHRAVLSRDGSTLYVRQSVEQGDVWLMNIDKTAP
jgi:Tol biopolymer transport system component